jgi:membrane protease YdiL (CAAX protease family)
VKFLETFFPFFFALMAIVFAPLIEEFIFRYPLVYSKNKTNFYIGILVIVAFFSATLFFAKLFLALYFVLPMIQHYAKKILLFLPLYQL